MALSFKYLNSLTEKFIPKPDIKWFAKFDALYRKVKRRKLDLLAFAVSPEAYEEIRKEWGPLHRSGVEALFCNNVPIYPIYRNWEHGNTEILLMVRLK